MATRHTHHIQPIRKSLPVTKLGAAQFAILLSVLVMIFTLVIIALHPLIT